MTNRIKAIFTALLILSAMCATAAAENQPPIAMLEAEPTYGEAPHMMYFDSYWSNDQDGTIVSYHWDFGDGNTSNEEDGYYVYNNSGNYALSLTVTDNEGATGYAYTNVTIVPGDNPITDNGMKAYVWNSDAEWAYNGTANVVASTLTNQGFNVTRHIAPTGSMIYQTISDKNVKIYYGIGHGTDCNAYTNNGVCNAQLFGDSIAGRDYPLTIGIFKHCGDYACYTPGRWLQESTQGNDGVVAQREYGTMWCGEASGAGDINRNTYIHLYSLNIGYTYEDAFGSLGRKQGNKDLRYPQFCGDVNYDRVVDPDDVELLQNHINDSTTYPIHADWDGDVNGDGSVDVYDANLLAYHVSDPAAYRLKPAGWFAGPCIWYDTNGEPGIQKPEAINAMNDYLILEIISKETAIAVMNCYFFPE